jgi:hypothetical protein
MPRGFDFGSFEMDDFREAASYGRAREMGAGRTGGSLSGASARLQLQRLREAEMVSDRHSLKVQTSRIVSSDQRNGEKIGPWKNVTAYRTVYLGDTEGRIAIERLKQFIEQHLGPSDALIFHSKRGAPPLQTTVVNQAPYLAL